jgi:hypothetical protein
MYDVWISDGDAGWENFMRNGSVSQFAGLLATLLITTGKTPDMTFYSWNIMK